MVPLITVPDSYTLRMRWLWVHRTDPSRPWLHLSDDREPLVEAMFQASVYLELGDGATALFWSDRWLQGVSLQELAPCLCRAVPSRVRALRTVAQALSNWQWIKDITRALTVQVLVEYLQTWDRMQLIQLSANPDRVCWKWTADRCFTTASAYQSFFVGQHPIKGAKLTPHPNASSSFGLPSTISVGQHIVVRSATCRPTILVFSVTKNQKLSTTSWCPVPLQDKSGTMSSAGSAGPFLRPLLMATPWQIGGPQCINGSLRLTGDVSILR